MLTIYVKLWRIDGQKQTHIKGKSFKVSTVDDVSEVECWVGETILKLLKKEGGEEWIN